MFLASVPKFVIKAFPSLIWKIPEKEKVLYLTFDDGPVPEATPWVLETLKKFNAKATFFCVGDNVRKHPQVFKQVLEHGHSVGNHTFNHMNGWTSVPEEYVENIEKAAEYINSNLFRPPRGLLRNPHYQLIKSKYKVIMWNVLSIDYEKKLSPQQCLKNVTRNAKPGSVVVFHDSIKAWKNMSYALPHVLEHFSALGYQFKAIEFKQLSQRKPSLLEMWFNYSFQRKRA